MAAVQMVNRMEPMVHQAVDEALVREKKVCSCERCRHDITALALNMLPPRYVVTPLGEVVTNVDLQSSQWKADIMMAVYRAIEIVRGRPRH
ncbi:MAG TPA: late competence development ComFB family protein [Candidatus Ozemobacteraceae bacterium]|nr:late competence development ComFB family protein [Candidatus Ozemobacteraceae bacterium]